MDYLSLLYDPENNPTKTPALIALGNSQIVSVLPTPVTAPAHALQSAVSFPNATMVDKGGATLTALIKNTGGFYDKKLIAFIFETTGGSSLTYIGYQTAYIDQNETKTINFTGEINLVPKNYKIAVYYQNASNEWTALTPSNYAQLNFTLIDSPTTLENIVVDKDVF